MNNNHINHLFEAFTPDENQKNKMWEAIQQKRHSAHRSTRADITNKRKRLITLSACLLVFLVSATAYAAVSDQFNGWVNSVLKGKGQKVSLANGETLHYAIDGNHKTVIGGDSGGLL